MYSHSRFIWILWWEQKVLIDTRTNFTAFYFEDLYIWLVAWMTMKFHYTHSACTSVVVETVSETSHLCWNNETIRFKSSLTSIIIESTYLTLNMNKIWGCFKVQIGWNNAFYGKTGSRKGLEKVSARPWPLKKHFLTFTLSVNKIIIYQFSMFKAITEVSERSREKSWLQHWFAPVYLGHEPHFHFHRHVYK